MGTGNLVFGGSGREAGVREQGKRRGKRKASKSVLLSSNIQWASGNSECTK